MFSVKQDFKSLHPDDQENLQAIIEKDALTRCVIPSVSAPPTQFTLTLRLLYFWKNLEAWISWGIERRLSGKVGKESWDFVSRGKVVSAFRAVINMIILPARDELQFTSFGKKLCLFPLLRCRKVVGDLFYVGINYRVMMVAQQHRMLSV